MWTKIETIKMNEKRKNIVKLQKQAKDALNVMAMNELSWKDG